MSVTWLDAISHGITVAASRAPEIDPQLAARQLGRQGGPPTSPAAVAGRASLSDAAAAVYGPPFGVYEPPAPDATWRELELDTKTLDALPTYQLLDILIDISPELSGAIWTFCRSCNPGWTCTVHTGPGEHAPRNTGAEAITDAFLARLAHLYGTVDIPINRLYVGAFVRGAFYGELVLGRDGREPIDLATPDPHKARFRRKKDPDRGLIWELGQWVGGQFQSFAAYETIRYLPVDPAPDNPYGRSIGGSALFTVLFLIGLMHDLRRVVSQQGYPRIDIEIVLDELVKTMPDDQRADPAALVEWAQEAVTQIGTIYAALAPDDAFVHTSSIQIHRPVGTVDVNSLSAVNGLISALERQVVRALKTMPLLLAVQEGTAEVQANRQWEVYTAGIKSIQHLCESLLQHLFQQALNAQGVAGYVRFRFAEIRASEALRDAQTLQLQMANAWNAYLHGWLSQEDAARMGMGVQRADQDEPRYVDGSLATPDMLAAAEPAAGSSETPEIAEPPTNLDGDQRAFRAAYPFLQLAVQAAQASIREHLNGEHP